MKEFPLNKGRNTKVDDEVFDWMIGLGFKWHVNSLGYAIRFNGRKVQLLHRLVVDCPRGLEVDHIDRDRLNNQRSNLRICNKTQQQGNRNGSRKTGFKGTIWRKRSEAWEAYITKSGKVKHLGTFRSEVEAAAAYNVAALEHFGGFARLNKV